MKKIKVVTVIGTRPELIRLSRVIDLLDKNLNHVLIHTGQNFDYELNKIFFNDLNLKKPKYQIKIKNNSPVSAISKILLEIDKILIREKPDAFIILGDTNSCLSAYCAKRMKIPIFHIEAGNRCYDQRVPEEINRKIIDHISDVNITYSEIAKNNLIKENINSDKVFKIGSPLDEVYNYYKDKIDNSKILKKYKLTKKNYYLVSVHREENIDMPENLNKFVNLLKYLNKSKKEKVLVTTHPRTMKKLKSLDLKKMKNVVLSKPFSYTDYSCLQQNSKFVLSDSGSITEEASILKFFALNLRSTNERQEGMSYGTVPMAHFDLNNIENIINFSLKNHQNKRKITDYTSPDFSKVFYNILISYIDYVKKYTWKLN
tara:strand:- start:389 stop:1507 length:1119 start_codon:yes stop_codon:yes gene_type:complete